MTAEGRYRHHRRGRYDRLPAGVRLVTRGSRWGNPHPVDRDCPRCRVVHDRADAIARYRADVQTAAGLVGLLAPSAGDPVAAWLAPLADADGLACTCRLEADCHADVLLDRLDHHYPRRH